MLHYTERKNRIHIITLDRILAADINERLCEYPGTSSAQLIIPGSSQTITPEDILKTARDTTDSKILIMDVRSQTKPPLQQAYSDIARFNRPDLNNFCHTVLIGDGPSDFLLQSKGTDAFQNYLADLRTDFSPAVFFANPFLYYTQQEIQDAIQNRNTLPEKIPQRLEKYFKKDVHIKTIYEYFRAAEKQGSMKVKRKKQRLAQLKDIFLKLAAEDFDAEGDKLAEALTKQGCSFAGEALKLNVYPFYFEEWIWDLLKFVPRPVND
jgi:transposase